jgi:DNA-binding NtrC family response regulator
VIAKLVASKNFFLKEADTFSCASKTTQMAKVLCTGWDRSLLETRTLILKSAGHEVHQARSQGEVVSACDQQDFDVAVIGQTVSNRMKRVVFSFVKEHCRDVKVLELYQPHVGKALEDADSWLEVPADIPSDLAERVGELVQLAEKQKRENQKTTKDDRIQSLSINNESSSPAE